MVRYEHTQPGHLLRWSLGGVLLLIVALSLYMPFSSKPAPIIIPASVALIIGTCLILMHSLTARVDDDAVVASFGPGLIKRRISLSDIADCQIVKNQWYYGWGIKMIPHGWMYNVSGLNAVELTLISGKKFRIGTDAPQELADAIRAAMRA
jgi:hypothetical protein